MKKIYLLTLLVICNLALVAQYKPVPLSKAIQGKTLHKIQECGTALPYLKSPNPVVSTKEVMDDDIGTSGVYDMQSNASSMERVVTWPDGTTAAIWMKSDVTGYGDCGTGYNYNDGNGWGPAPTARIETIRTGSPNLCMWNGNGELVLAHSSTPNLVMNTRPVKGTGNWTQTLAPTGPVGQGGTNVNLLWPRAITNGTNHQNIHIICLTMPTANGGIKYKGLDGALIYYRSQDGGLSWDRQGVQIAGLDSLHYNGFKSETYTWIEPHGDTIAFILGSTWNGTFLMKSFDNGNSWIKQDIIVPYWAKNTTDVTPAFYGCDGTMAGAMDKHGVFHVAFGRMYARQYNGPEGFGRYWDAATDGLIYWNSTELPLDSALMSSLDSLDVHQQLIGYVAPDQNGDSIVGFPYYGGGLSSYPAVVIEPYTQYMYIVWSGVTVLNPDPTPYNYRHIWGRTIVVEYHGWLEMEDYNSDILYFGTEFVYPEVPKKINDWYLYILTQISPQPGSNVEAGSTYPPVPVHLVDFLYQEVPLWVGGLPPSTKITQNYVGQNFPNPVHGITSFVFKVGRISNITVEVSDLLGNPVIKMDEGIVQTGSKQFDIDCSGLTSGIYFYTVKFGNNAITKKMVVL
jgi:hypothetical protein